MSRHSPKDEFDQSSSIYDETQAAERAVIAACLIKPVRIAEIAGRIHPDDIVNPLHRRVLEALIAIAEEGRTPSIEALAANFGATEEVAPRVTLRGYLLDIAKQGADGLFLPWLDAVEVVIDQSRRRRLAAIGSHLTQGSTLATRASDLATEAVGMIDNVLADMRTGQRLSYDAGGAGAAALARLDSDARAYPTTGLEDLDKMIGGWPLGQLSVVAGRPGAGKSAVATSTLLRTAKTGIPAAFFSLEMTREQLGSRMLADLAYTRNAPIMYEDILNRRVDSGRRHRLEEAQSRLAQLPISIEEQQGLSVAEIAARSRKIAATATRAGQRLRVHLRRPHDAGAIERPLCRKSCARGR